MGRELHQRHKPIGVIGCSVTDLAKTLNFHSNNALYTVKIIQVWLRDNISFRFDGECESLDDAIPHGLDAL